MDEENGSSPPQVSTHDSEGNNEPGELHVDRNLPKYLTDPLVRKDDHTKCLTDVAEDEQETGLGDDSNEDANKLNAIDDEIQTTRMFRLMIITEHESNEDIEVSYKNSVEFETKLSKNILPKYKDSLYTS